MKELIVQIDGNTIKEVQMEIDPESTSPCPCGNADCVCLSPSGIGGVITTLDDSLNRLLASEIVLSFKLKGFHWNLVDKEFFYLHALWDEHYELVQVYIDEIAERIRSKDNIPVSSLTSVLKLSSIKEEMDTLSNSSHQLKALHDDHNTLSLICQEVIAMAEADKDNVTMDLATRLSNDHMKLMWMLKSSL